MVSLLVTPFRPDNFSRKAPRSGLGPAIFVGNISGADLSIWNGRKEVIPLAKKMNCGCGCVPPGKTAKRKVKTESAKAPKKRK
jgi:hypothetical protein